MDLNESNRYGLPCKHFMCKDCFKSCLESATKNKGLALLETTCLAENNCLEIASYQDF